MIVTSGKNVIVNYFGGQYRHIGDVIAVGTGTTAVTLADTALAAEVTRVAVTSIAADTDNNRIIFKATIPAGSVTTINEVGVYYRGLSGTTGGDVLVARTVLTTPVTVDDVLPTEIEYSLEITI